MINISTADAPDTSVENAANAFADILSPVEDTQEEGEAPAAYDQDYEDTADAAQYADNAADEDYEAADPEDDEDFEEGDQPPVYTVKVDGQEIQVSLDELQKGYSRTQDYTRKTQHLAEMRKAAEAEFEAVRAERAQYSQVLNALRQQAEANVSPPVDWNKLRQEDPIEFAARWAEHQQKLQQVQAIQAEHARVAQLQQQEHMQYVAATVVQGRETLREVIPEWRNPEVAKREKAALVEFGKQLGYDAQELAGIVDPRAVVALRKAYLYDKMTAARGQVRPKASAGPTLKPGNPTGAPRKGELTRAKARLAKSGQVQDAAAAFESLLLGRG